MEALVQGKSVDTTTSMTHVCCDFCFPDDRVPGIALCGKVVTSLSISSDIECVVCLDLEDTPCARCGA